MSGRTLALTLALAASFAAAAGGDEYQPADKGQRPAGSEARILPEAFLRGYDPITVYFPSDESAGPGPADAGAARLTIAPPWPGAWQWTDKRTLQFRPAEAWPALARFAVEAAGARRTLTTMMSPPASMAPADGSVELRPFRTLTLSFAQPLPLAWLRSMLRLELVDLPGLADSPRRAVKSFSLAQLPRAAQRDPATYALTLDEEVPEGKRLQISAALALGESDKVLWTGRLATRTPFHLEQIRCGSAQLSLAGPVQVPRDLALACGNGGEAPQLVFSAPVANLKLSALMKLARLEPSVAELHFETYGGRVSLRGKFVPDTLYQLRLGAAPIQDDSGRPLQDPGTVEAFFYLGWKSPFLRFSQASALLEANGPRLLPLEGYGDARADVRIYRVDPMHPGLWPFPAQPVLVDEESAPPFPGEEPEKTELARSRGRELSQHLRLLGSPLVSRVVDLPTANRAGRTRFGLDLAPLLDPVLGKGKPGTYLVGLRRLTGAPQRSYVRVQITNLALTAVEERTRAVLYVRTLDKAEPVSGARIALEGRRTIREKNQQGTEVTRIVDAREELVADREGRALLERLAGWVEVLRVSVAQGDDVLVLDPSDPPPQFAGNHWSSSTSWLRWIGQEPPRPEADRLLGFLGTERAIYRPGESVFFKGWVRQRRGGLLEAPSKPRAADPDKSLLALTAEEMATQEFGLEIDGPDGVSRPLQLTFTALFGFSAELNEKDPPSGRWTARLVRREGAGRSMIAQRQFQIEAYRVPTFEVRLSGAPVVRLDGPFQVKAVARFYAGGNVAKAPIAWTVTRRQSWHVPPGRQGFLFASSAQFARAPRSRSEEPTRREAQLDEKGSADLSINPALDVDGTARIYRIEATVIGPDGQEVSAAQEVSALPPFVMGMKLQRYAETAGELKPEIVAVGVDGKLVGGQEIAVRLYKRVWHSHLRETNFAAGEAKYVTEQEDQKLLEKTVRTDAARPVIPLLPLPEAGVYLVELFARDKLGRVQTLSADLYAGGRGAVAWQKPREGVFEVTPDKKSYRPGDIAKLVVQSPFQGGVALVIVEEPEGNTYRFHEVNAGKVVAGIPIDARSVPNLPVHVVLLRGRTGEGKQDDGRFKPQTLASSLELEVEPVKNQVAVRVEHPDAARPGQTVELTVTLQDDKQRGLAGEVTLWLVDEAVLSLAKETSLEALPAFLVRNARNTSVRDTRNLVIGRVAEQEDDPGGDGAEADAKEASAAGGSRKRIVRKTFKTVPYYAATLLVPASGKLVVPVVLSDDLTNFKVRASAVSGLERFGYWQSTLRVRLPVIVQPQLPRLVRQGDRFWPGGIARLVEGAEDAGTVDLSIEGPVDFKPGSQKIELALDRAQSALFPATVRSASAGAPAELIVRMGVTRTSDGVGDAFEVKLPILPDRAIEHDAFFRTLTAGRTTFRGLPEAARAGTLQQRLIVTGQPGVLEFVAGLDYLARYPHGCLEQRMSQTWPLIAHAGLLRTLGLDSTYGVQGALAVRAVLDELPGFQEESGLVGYWPGTPGDVVLSAQALQFLLAARTVGVAVDDKLQAHLVTGLRRVLRSDYPGLVQGYSLNQQVSAMRALAMGGDVDEAYLVDLFQRRRGMDTSSLSDLLLAMEARPQLFAQNLATLRQDLWDSVRLKLIDGKPAFEGLEYRRTSWKDGWLDTRLSALAATFESLVAVDPENPRLATVRDGLLASATAVGGFGSTSDNRRAMSALAAYLLHARDGGPRAQVELTWDNGGHETLSIDDKHKIGHARVTGAGTLSATVKGDPVLARMSYSYLPEAPGDQAAPLAGGFRVERSWSPVTADGAAGPEAADKHGELRKLHAGDLLELHARLTTEQPRAQVALIVPFAAGLELLNPELQNVRAGATPSQRDSLAPTFMQRMDGEVRYYFNQLPAGTHSFHFRLRAASEGSFVHPAAWAEQMYHQEIRGRSEGLRVIVLGQYESP